VKDKWILLLLALVLIDCRSKRKSSHAPDRRREDEICDYFFKKGQFVRQTQAGGGGLDWSSMVSLWDENYLAAGG
jgi:hypothetical protein